MTPKYSFAFGPFRADFDAQCLWRERESIELRPKTWDVLRYLLENPGRVVTKNELLDRVWAGTIVTEGTLTQSIRELRTALDDDAKRPRFIATVHKRGYRFVANVVDNGSVSAPAEAKPPTSFLVGRDLELAQLHEALVTAMTGQRGCVFVTGEPGIGKTTVLDELMRRAAASYGDKLVIVRGQCVEQRRQGEPYLPVLEALHQLCRGSHGPRVVETLRRYAPTWLVQMPWLLTAEDLDALRQQLMGSGPERMLRELGIALEEVATHTPLLMIFEDLHWSDVASADLIAALARRRDPTSLLIVGSIRTAASGTQRHPLQDLVPALTTRGQALEIRLEALAPAAVRDYVMHRLDEQAPEALVDAIERHSAGSPLFLVTALGYALAQKWVVQRDGVWTLTIAASALEAAVPMGLRQLIETQVAGLTPEDRSLLEAASVAGMEISPRSLGVALDQPKEETEAALDQLSQRVRFLRRVSAVTDAGEVADRFEFSHALYQYVLYTGTAPTWRRQQHLHMARGLRAEYGDRDALVAAELALHYERGGAYEEAARYLGVAALNANQRIANREAAVLIEHALALLAQVEDSPRRKRREADLCIQLGAVRGSIYGRGAESYIGPFLRAWELSQELDDIPRMFLSRMAGFGHFSVTEQFGRAEEVCRDLMALAGRAPMPDLVAVANGAMGSVLCGMGRLEESREHLERALATLNPHDPATQLFRRLEDPEILCLTGLAWVLAQLGFVDQARKHCTKALVLGKERAPYHHVYCLNAAAILHLFLDQPESCLFYSQKVLELAQEHNFDGFIDNAIVLASWGRERSTPSAGAWQRLQRDVDAYRRCNQRFGVVSYQLLVADACLREGAIAEGIAAIATAQEIMNASGERAGAGNLLRLRALLLAASGAAEESVEACFAEALAAARQNHARLSELRTSTDLAAWWRDRGQAARARALLAPMYAWFTEGFDAPDLRRAQAVLASL